MTDVDLVLKKLAFMETCLAELRALARPDELQENVKERRFVEHTLQVCIQAAQDIASHVVSNQRLGEPATNHELFTFLASGGWLLPATAKALRAAVGFRNVVVHGYAAVNVEIMRNVLEEHLTDLDAFVREIRSHLDKP